MLNEGDRFPDWVTTIAFYKAIHLIDALLYKQCESHGYNHGTRNDIVRRTYPTIYNNYSVLSQSSRVARYLNDQYDQFMDIETVKSTILGHHLKRIQSFVEKKLSPVCERKGKLSKKKKPGER